MRYSLRYPPIISPYEGVLRPRCRDCKHIGRNLGYIGECRAQPLPGGWRAIAPNLDSCERFERKVYQI